MKNLEKMFNYSTSSVRLQYTARLKEELKSVETSLNNMVNTGMIKETETGYMLTPKGLSRRARVPPSAFDDFYKSTGRIKTVRKKIKGAQKQDVNIYNVISAGLLDSHVFEISQEIVKLLNLTKNKLTQDHKLPFATTFIDSTLKTKRCIYFGFLLLEQKTLKHEAMLFSLFKDNKTKELSVVFISNLYNKDISEDLLLKDNLTSPFKLRGENTRIRTFLANVIDFLNDPEVIYTEYKEKKKSKIKRIQTSSKIVRQKITVRGELKKYIHKLRRITNSSFKFSHRFWVRGHWRRYPEDSEKFVNMRGKKKWIKPFIKGEGILIEKKYDLKPR